MKPHSSLRDRTRELLINRSRTMSLPKISQETGLSVPWLKKISAYEIVNPGVVQIQKLYEFLTGEKLVS